MLKRIRIDYYHYRIRRGRADILLQHVAREGDLCCVPFHYVEKGEGILSRLASSETEDDGDLVINDYCFGSSHSRREDREWIPLFSVLDKRILRNESMHVFHNIFRFFLLQCPVEVEPCIRQKAELLLDTVLTNIARMRYKERLQQVLDGQSICIPDCSVSQPDPELVQREIDTLEHFCLVKPDGDDTYRKEYSYEPIDWEALGSVRKPVPSFFRQDSFDIEAWIGQISDKKQ